MLEHGLDTGGGKTWRWSHKGAIKELQRPLERAIQALITPWQPGLGSELERNSTDTFKKYSSTGQKSCKILARKQHNRSVDAYGQYDSNLSHGQ